MCSLIARQRFPSWRGRIPEIKPSKYGLAGILPLQPQFIKKPVKVSADAAWLLLILLLMNVEISMASGIYGWRNSSYHHFISAVIRRAATDSPVKYCQLAKKPLKKGRQSPSSLHPGGKTTFKPPEDVYNIVQLLFLHRPLLEAKWRWTKYFIEWALMTFAFSFFFKWADLFKEKKKVYEKHKLTSDGEFNLQWSHRLKNIKSFYLNSNKNHVSHRSSGCFQLHLKAYYFQVR